MFGDVLLTEPRLGLDSPLFPRTDGALVVLFVGVVFDGELRSEGDREEAGIAEDLEFTESECKGFFPTVDMIASRLGQTRWREC